MAQLPQFINWLINQPTVIDVSMLTGTWTSFSPSVTSSVGTITTSSASGSWIQIGKLVHFKATITITTNGTGAGVINLGLPATAGTNLGSVVVGRGNAVSLKMIQGIIAPAGTTTQLTNYDNTYPGVSGESIVVSGTYESA